MLYWIFGIIFRIVHWLSGRKQPAAPVGDHLALVVQRDFVTAVGCVKEVVLASQRKSTHPLGYSVQAALNALSYGGYASLGDGGAPLIVGLNGSKLTKFLRYVLPILKKWVEKLLPSVFGVHPGSAALSNEDLKVLEDFLAMPNDP